MNVRNNDNENSQNINIKQIMFEHDVCFLKPIGS